MSEPHAVPRVQLAPLSARALLDACRPVSVRDGDVDVPALEDQLRLAPGDGILLDWDLTRPDGAPDPRGLYAVLGAAARVQRVVFPARWLPVRPSDEGTAGSAHPSARVLAFARSDTALQRLFAEATPELEGRGLARPDEPVVLLGVEGDVLAVGAGSGAAEPRRRAEHWIHRLGADRVALAVPADAGDEHPLAALARHRALPSIVVSTRARRGAPAATPLLWSDFQLDAEHRLPDDAHVPGLRDLIHRGALLRERTLHERLPASWRNRLDAELRALYAWHVSPLLRRVAALVQTVDAVDGAAIEAPFPDLHSVTAYLLGLTDHRPVEAAFSLIDPVESARRLAVALQGFDRRLHVQVADHAWNQLRARLSGWSETGFLARCDDGGRGIEFCFSGSALVQRAPLCTDPDGLARIELGRADRAALGWFRLTCQVVDAARRPSRVGRVVAEVRGEIVAGPSPRTQLPLAFDDDVPYQENTA